MVSPRLIHWSTTCMLVVVPAMRESTDPWCPCMVRTQVRVCRLHTLTNPSPAPLTRYLHRPASHGGHEEEDHDDDAFTAPVHGPCVSVLVVDGECGDGPAVVSGVVPDAHPLGVEGQGGVGRRRPGLRA